MPDLPELITEGDTVKEAPINALDALAAMIEAYLRRPGTTFSSGVETDGR